MANLVCSECKKILQENYPTERDSHGICDNCLHDYLIKLDLSDSEIAEFESDTIKYKESVII